MKNKNFRYSLNSKAFIIGAVIIVLLLNAILISLDSKIPLEFDFTESKIYALTEETESVIDQIEEPIEILLLTTGTENEIVSMIENVLNKYTQRNSKISVREVDVIKNPMEIQEFIQQIATMNLGSLIIRQGERAELVNAADFFSQNNYSYIERVVTTKLAGFVDGMTLSSAYLTIGHGESLPTNSAVKILEMGGYKVEQFDTLSQDFPQDGKSVVIIAAPTSDFSAEEIDKLDSYLDRGGNVQIYYDPAVSPALPNLDSYLLKDWGIERHDHFVLDAGRIIENSGYLMIGEMSDHEITAPVKTGQKRAGYGPANSFSVAADKPAGVSVETLLSTTENAYAKAGLDAIREQGSVEKSAGDAEGSFDVMMAATREKTDVNNETITGRLVVGGSVYIIDQLTTDTRFANEDILLNTVNWMNDGNVSLTVRAKAIPGGVMSLTVTQFWVWAVILVIVIPLVVLAGGIIVFTKRRYK